MLSPVENASYSLLPAVARTTHTAHTARTQPSHVAWPRTAWGTEMYRAALRSISALHAEWWDLSEEAGPWQPLDIIYSPERGICEAHAALDRIASAAWGSRLLTAERVTALRKLLDNPSQVLASLSAMPRTLVAVDHEESLVQDACGGFDLYPFGAATVGIGPAAYDLACFYSGSRWRFGRTPLSMTSTRAYYLQHLNADLPDRADRCDFDEAFDAALAWRFAALWTRAIASSHICLLAQSHTFSASVVEPAFASLARLSRG
jgi:hypothetical protein